MSGSTGSNASSQSTTASFSFGGSLGLAAFGSTSSTGSTAAFGFGGAVVSSGGGFESSGFGSTGLFSGASSSPSPVRATPLFENSASQATSAASSYPSHFAFAQSSAASSITSGPALSIFQLCCCNPQFGASSSAFSLSQLTPVASPPGFSFPSIATPSFGCGSQSIPAAVTSSALATTTTSAFSRFSFNSINILADTSAPLAVAASIPVAARVASLTASSQLDATFATSNQTQVPSLSTPALSTGIKMGKKRRRASSKSREISSHRDKETKLKSGDKYFCCTCKITVQAYGINIHFEGKKHKRLEKLKIYEQFLQDQGLMWMEELPFFTCNHEGCDPSKKLQARYSVLESHVKNVHLSSLKTTPPPQPKVVFNGSLEPKILRSVQSSDRPKVYWKNEYKIEDHIWNETKQIKTPTEIRGIGSDELLLHYMNANFSNEQLREMTNWASYIEKNGQRVLEGELKGGTKMVAHGYRYAYGKIGRFCQLKYSLCYSSGEELATMLCEVLKKIFPQIFKHLEAVWEKEGMPINVARVGNAPFTTMCITKDYSCNPHIDAHDNSFEFFIWIGANGDKDEFGNEVKFYLPALDYFLIPKIGDVLLLKSKDLYHCTKTLGSKGQYGIALFQNSPFFRHHAILRDRLAKGVCDKFTKSWLESEKFYGHI